MATGPVLLQPPPVSWPPMIVFAKITQICYFFVFLNCRKVGKFAASIECPKTKSAPASGASPPDSLTRGSAPEPRLGICPQTSFIGLHYRARHGAIPPRYCGLEPPLPHYDQMASPRNTLLFTLHCITSPLPYKILPVPNQHKLKTAKTQFV